jgi:hypothetical protein
VSAKLTPWPPPFNQFDPAHFDFTVTDGNGTAWVDVHLKSNDTEKKVLVSGPRPGGWTVTLSYEICEGSLPGIKIDDQFNTQVIVRQPM